MRVHEMLENLCSQCDFEENLKKQILRVIQNSSYEIKSISGGVLVERAGEGPKTMLLCNLARTRFLLTETKENKAKGIFFGDISAAAWPGAQMLFTNGLYGIVHSRNKEKEMKPEDLYLDCGIACEENGIEKNMFAYPKELFIQQKNMIFGNALSAKAGAVVLLDVLQKCLDWNRNICFVFLYNTELGNFSPAYTVAQIQPEYLFTVSGYAANEKFSVGKGTGILLKDGNAVVGEKMRRWVINTAEEEQIPYQIYLGKKSALNERLSVAGRGTLLGGICLPVEWMGEPTEKICVNDLEKSINLLLKVLQKL